MLNPTGWPLEIAGMSKSIVEHQKVVPIGLKTPEDVLQKKSISPMQHDFNPNMAAGVYSLLYCSTATLLSGILGSFHSRNPLLLTPTVQGEGFFDQITGGIYCMNTPINYLSLWVT